MDTRIDLEVRRRSEGMCEYCHAPQAAYAERFQIDHIIARQHGGNDGLENLALCCVECNLRKGPNIASIDPLTKEIVPLYNPRLHHWNEHFVW